LSQHKRRGSVAQVVESLSREARRLQQRLKLMRDHGAGYGIALVRGENQVPIIAAPCRACAKAHL